MCFPIEAMFAFKGKNSLPPGELVRIRSWGSKLFPFSKVPVIKWDAIDEN